MAIRYLDNPLPFLQMANHSDFSCFDWGTVARLMWSGDKWNVSPSSTQNEPARPMDPGLGRIIGIDACGCWQS